MHIRNILVGYDESLPAKRALSLAEDLAIQYGARLLLVTVVPFSPALGMGLGMPPPAPTETEIAATRQILEREAARMRSEGRRVEVLVEVGDPASCLQAAGDRLEIDVTVLGRSGKGAVARVVMGSVTTALLHATCKPLIVVP